MNTVNKVRAIISLFLLAATALLLSGCWISGGL